MLSLTSPHLDSIVQAITRDLDAFADKYNESKYPPSDLERLRRAFARPSSVSAADIRDALVWKFGHSGKDNYPQSHRNLADRIARRWRIDSIRPDETPEAAFRRWRQAPSPMPFITACFLLHLCRPDDIPILDQHNFRSVQFHLRGAGVDVTPKKRPGTFDDLMLVQVFASRVLKHWRRATSKRAPSPSRLDRYLMMHGKSIKNART